MKWLKALDIKTSPSYSMGKSIVQLVLETPNEKMDEVLKLLNGKFELVLQKQKKKRSLSANAYMWALCEKIAQKQESITTKEDIYRAAIRQVGVWTDIGIIPVAYETFKRDWERHGIGYIAEISETQKKWWRVRCYKGSSEYDTKQMARLIEWLVQEAEALDIDTLTPRERSLLIDEWDRRKGT